MHEIRALAATRQKAQGVRTLDIAKRLLDFGVHPPTIYFPLVVPEALMIEPTETESKESLDHFIAALRQIADEAAETPEIRAARAAQHRVQAPRRGGGQSQPQSALAPGTRDGEGIGDSRRGGLRNAWYARNPGHPLAGFRTLQRALTGDAWL